MKIKPIQLFRLKSRSACIPMKNSGTVIRNFLHMTCSNDYNSFKIDQTIGKDTSVTVTYTNDTVPHVSLVLPSIYGRGKEVRYDEFKDTGYS